VIAKTTAAVAEPLFRMVARVTFIVLLETLKGQLDVRGPRGSDRGAG
jgi:hypothetical protein